MNHFDQLLDRLLGRGPDEPLCMEQLRCAHTNIDAGRTVSIDGEERTPCYCADCSSMLGWMGEVAAERQPVTRDSQRDAKSDDCRSEPVVGYLNEYGEERVELPIPADAQYDIDDHGDGMIIVQWWQTDESEVSDR
jgi:hypothetical protein